MQNTSTNTVQESVPNVATVARPANVDYVHRFVTSMLFTTIIETLILIIVVAFLFKYKIIKEKIFLKYQVFAGFFASFATIPYVWYIFPNLLYLQMNRQESLAYSEPFVFLVEVFVYRFVLRIGWRWCVAISLLANLASYYVGPFLRSVGFWIYW